MVRAWLEGPVDAGLRSSLEVLVRRTEEVGTLEQRLATARQVLGEYRSRLADLMAQVATLRSMKGSDAVVRGLEKHWKEMNERVALQTKTIVDLEEHLTLARVALQMGVAELSLPETPAGTSARVDGASSR